MHEQKIQEHIIKIYCIPYEFQLARNKFILIYVYSTQEKIICSSHSIQYDYSKILESLKVQSIVTVINALVYNYSSCIRQQ